MVVGPPISIIATFQDDKTLLVKSEQSYLQSHCLLSNKKGTCCVYQACDTTRAFVSREPRQGRGLETLWELTVILFEIPLFCPCQLVLTDAVAPLLHFHTGSKQMRVLRLIIGVVASGKEVPLLAAFTVVA